MGRIAAIDFGLKRIGLAVSDPGRVIAFPVATVEGGKKAIDNIRAALGAKLKEVDLILIGLPLLMSGKEGEMALAVKQFAAQVELALKIPVEPIDERLSSKLADQSLRQIQLNRKERTENMDVTAATLLLQSYLDQKK